MKLRLVSFGYKYGREVEDFNIFYDARFLKNPYWDENLRQYNGKNQIIWDFILDNFSSVKFLESLIFTVESSLDHFKGRNFTVGVACSGGQHRSVFVVEYLKKYFEKKYEVEVFHRDIDKSKVSKKRSPVRREGDQNPKIVCLGGGHGLSNLLNGLKRMPFDITAIVNVTDDGGSTGRLREIFQMPAPGDIRRVLLSLVTEVDVFDKLFNYRFKDIDENFDGHALGNLVLAAAYEANNEDFLLAVEDLSKMLNIKGQVLPIAASLVELNCVYEDGEVVKGESKINKDKKIDHVSLSHDIDVNKKVVNEILSADIIVFSQGSLYTSLIANMLFPEVKNALRMSTAKIIYIANLLTQCGETSGYTVADHVKAIEKEIGEPIIDTVLINNNFKINDDVLAKYALENSYLVKEIGDIESKELIVEDFIEVNKEGLIRHKSRKVASRLYELALEYLD